LKGNARALDNFFDGLNINIHHGHGMEVLGAIKNGHTLLKHLIKFENHFDSLLSARITKS